MTPKELITPAVNPAADPGWIFHLGKKQKRTTLEVPVYITSCMLPSANFICAQYLKIYTALFLILRAFLESPFFHRRKQAQGKYVSHVRAPHEWRLNSLPDHTSDLVLFFWAWHPGAAPSGKAGRLSEPLLSPLMGSPNFPLTFWITEVPAKCSRKYYRIQGRISQPFLLPTKERKNLSFHRNNIWMCGFKKK